jgi:hypothetical protein
MPAVDRDAMPPAQRAAWDQLWRVLLAPNENEETRPRTELGGKTEAGNETATAETAAGRHDTTNRGGNLE